MNEILELSRHPEYVHVLLSHFPVVGLGLALVVLCVGLIKADRALTLTGLVMEGVLSGMALWVIESGEQALEHIKVGLAPEAAVLVEAHAMMGETWGVLYFTTAITCVVAVVVAWKWPKRLWLPSVVAAGFGVLATIVGISIAHSGGKVRHPEFRMAPASTGQAATPSYAGPVAPPTTTRGIPGLDP